VSANPPSPATSRRSAHRAGLRTLVIDLDPRATPPTTCWAIGRREHGGQRSAGLFDQMLNFKLHAEEDRANS
jgi:hypothetical protein